MKESWMWVAHAYYFWHWGSRGRKIMSLRPAWTTQRDPVKEKKKKKIGG